MQRFVTLGLATLGLIATGCGSSSPKPAAKLAGPIAVSAASSLTQAFAKIRTDFEAANPATTVTFNFGPSSTLETQIAQGAPADVFASADSANMDKLATAGLLNGAATVFAKNRLVIVTKPGNPQHVKTLADLATVGTISLCGIDVPCGKYAAQALQAAGVTINETKITRGADVKATLASVTTGDADAAIVYVTDARGAGAAVQMVAIPDAQNVVATYPAAALTGSNAPKVGRAFVAFLTSPPAQAVLASFGFLPSK